MSNQERTVIEGCGYADYDLPGDCGGEMRGFEHAYGYGALVELCDRHYEIAPDPLLLIGPDPSLINWDDEKDQVLAEINKLIEADRLLLCKAWKEKDHQVLARFAKRADPHKQYNYYDRDGKLIEY